MIPLLGLTLIGLGISLGGYTVYLARQHRYLVTHLANSWDEPQTPATQISQDRQHLPNPAHPLSDRATPRLTTLPEMSDHYCI